VIACTAWSRSHRPLRGFGARRAATALSTDGSGLRQRLCWRGATSALGKRGNKAETSLERRQAGAMRARRRRRSSPAGVAFGPGLGPILALVLRPHARDASRLGARRRRPVAFDIRAAWYFSRDDSTGRGKPAYFIVTTRAGAASRRARDAPVTILSVDAARGAAAGGLTLGPQNSPNSIRNNSSLNAFLMHPRQRFSGIVAR
jgi:hypothetical protein